MSESKKEIILQVSRKLFIENGFTNTPTSMICREASVATGTLFHHFKTKEELLNALYLDAKLSLKKHISLELNKSNDLKEMLRIVWQNYIGWAMQYPEKFTFLRKFSESPQISTQTREQVDNVFQHVFTILDKGRKAGTFLDLPTQLMVGLVNTYFISTARFFVENPDSYKKKLVKRVFSSFWQAIKSKA